MESNKCSICGKEECPHLPEITPEEDRKAHSRYKKDKEINGSRWVDADYLPKK